MARTNPHDPHAKYCVSVTAYYQTLAEADAHFARSKNLPDTTIDLYEKNAETGDWGEPTDWSGYDDD